VATYLLASTAASSHPLYQRNPMEKAMSYVEHPVPADGTAAAALYEHYLHFLDRILDVMEADDCLSDRMDAKTAAWCVAARQNKPESWVAEDWKELLQYRTEEGNGPLPPPPNGDGDPLSLLAQELLVPPSFLKEIDALIDDRKQVIFYGPPGTGKTFVGMKLAEVLAESGDNVSLVQFHPSYAYEDFVEGYRPGRGGHGFELVEGPLKEIAHKAEADPEGTYYLLIDEINRGNVARVFGELYFLLEYRDHAITLQYSREPFSLPANLFIIGTMNTADRSIALIDAALRRRFHFVGFFPDDDSIGGVLRRWLTANAPELQWVADVVDKANTHLDRHGAIGPSHFMKQGLTENRVRLIWKHSVIPYIEELFFGDQERIDDFGLDRLRDIGIGAELQEGEGDEGTSDD